MGGGADSLRQALKKGQGGFGSFQYAFFWVSLSVAACFLVQQQYLP